MADLILRPAKTPGDLWLHPQGFIETTGASGEDENAFVDSGSTMYQGAFRQGVYTDV